MPRRRRRIRPLSQTGGFGHRNAPQPKRLRDPLKPVAPYLEDLNQRVDDQLLSAPAAIAVMREYVQGTIGVGIKVNPEVDHGDLGVSKSVVDDFVNKHNRLWKIWNKKKNADFYGRFDFNNLTRLVEYGARAYGDIVALFPESPTGMFRTRVQLISAHRIESPLKNPYKDQKVVDGVALDEHGRELGIWIRSQDKKGKDTYTFYPNVVDGRTQYARIIRGARQAEDVRGISILVSIVESISKMADFLDAETTAAFVQACFAGFVTSDADRQPRGGVRHGSDDKSAEPAVREREITPGTLQWLSRGESVNFAAPSRPSQGILEFIKANMAVVSMACGISAGILLQMFDKSYTAARAEIKSKEFTLDIERSMLVTDFIEIAREQFVDECVERGFFYAPGYFDDPLMREAWLNATYQGPPPLQVDPLKEVMASRIKVHETFSSLEKEAMTYGNNWNEQFQTILREQRALAEMRGEIIGPDLEAGAIQEAVIEEAIHA